MSDDPNKTTLAESAHGGAQPATPKRIITIPVAILLLLTIVFSTSAYVHAQLLHLGGQVWHQYNFLRVDMPKPTCDAHPDVAAEVAAAKAKSAQEAADSLFSSGPLNVEALRESIQRRAHSCELSQQRYEYNHKERQSPVLRSYVAVELGVGWLNNMGQTAMVYLLMLVVLIGGIAAKMADEHICLRPPVSRLDYRFSDGAQLLANLVMLAGSIGWWYHDTHGAHQLQSLPLHLIWIVGFLILTVMCARQFLRPPASAVPGGNPARAFLSTPLYTWLAGIGGLYFVLGEHYVAEMIVQVLRMIQFSDLYLAVALYIWAGVLLKYTNLTEVVFDILRPWKLAPELITIAIVLIAAVP
ncbi:MAG: hypothetical protein L0H54_14385, partial [Alcaligenaceae bacterium]|nr:hypothetical protein [Alcaligenaceae bacterium]